MSEKELYRKTFSKVHSSVVIDEAFFQKKPGRRRRGRIMLLAAVLLVGLSTVAVAENWLNLQQIMLPERQMAGQAAPGKGEEPAEAVDLISMAGYLNTPEGKAVAEWQAFLSSYDADGAIIAAVGNRPTGFEERYGQYLVYTQEMADRLEEIAARHHLKLHTEQIDCPDRQTFCEHIGGDCMNWRHEDFRAYLYEDGTFGLDNCAYLAGYGKVDYQLTRVVKGSFTDLALNIGAAAEYHQWQYQTACGVGVTLALSGQKGLILADLENAFVTVNVLAGKETPAGSVFSSGPFFEADLEALADSFDFTVLEQNRNGDEAG